jgi:hypothetical protein
LLNYSKLRTGNQLYSFFHVTIPEQGDFLVDGKYVVEIGGKNKKKGSNQRVSKILSSVG